MSIGSQSELCRPIGTRKIEDAVPRPVHEQLFTEFIIEQAMLSQSHVLAGQWFSSFLNVALLHGRFMRGFRLTTLFPVFVVDVPIQ
jgi:hypothetical protein